MTKTGWFSGYRGSDEIPLGGYAALIAAYGLILGTALSLLSRRGGLPRWYAIRDLFLAGIATHRLTRTLTQHKVTAPLRAAFTEYQGSVRKAEATEKSRGTGLRQALGELLTCPVCAGPWVAVVLLWGLAAAPRATRFLTGTFTAATISDFLHQGYEAASSKVQSVVGGVERDRAVLEISEGARP
jgi:hypothetical protein